MFTKKIKYTDYAGETREEEFRFNMTKAEVVEWQYSIKGGINNLFHKIINDNDQPALVTLIKDLIRRSYGEPSIDNRKFVKVRNGAPLYEDFEATPAYDILFMELVQDEAAAAAFLNGLMPDDLVAAVAAQEAGLNVTSTTPNAPASTH